MKLKVSVGLSYTTPFNDSFMFFLGKMMNTMSKKIDLSGKFNLNKKAQVISFQMKKEI